MTNQPSGGGKSAIQWPEAVREWDRLRNAPSWEICDLNDWTLALVGKTDAAIVALKAEVERLKDINKRLDWMMEEAALLLTERGVYVSLQEAIADLAARYEKEHP